MFECSACESSNVLTNGTTKTDAHSMSNLIRHQETDLHKFKVHVLSRKMGRDNPLLCKIFDQIEMPVGKNMFLLGDGHLICRSCKGVKISLTSRGSALQRAKSHLNSKDHKKLNVPATTTVDCITCSKASHSKQNLTFQYSLQQLAFLNQ